MKHRFTRFLMPDTRHSARLDGMPTPMLVQTALHTVLTAVWLKRLCKCFQCLHLHKPPSVSPQSVCLHMQVALAVLLALMVCALASDAPHPHPRKLAATINIIAAPNTGNGSVNCIKVPAALCERTEEATCTSDTQTEGACCNKDYCIVLDKDIFADAECADYGACCPGAA